VTAVTVVGAQWGDEGKGKIVDWLSAQADVIVRFQGGHNAGHTLVVSGEVYKLSLLPSGVVRPDTLSVIGNGVVFDPWAFVDEVARLSAQGLHITPETLAISDTAALILPFHSDLDGAREGAGGGIGTTRRGIGPAYEDKVGRRAIRICDLGDEAALRVRLPGLLNHHNALRRGFGMDEIDGEALICDLLAIAPHILPFVRPVWAVLDEARKADKKILYEGAQGAMLDVDHGTYPFVTSSNTVAGQIAAGSGSGPKAAGTVLGLTKAYATRVGEGPFPSELFDADGDRLGQRGHEFGTVTGRKRRCGWFDAVMARQAVITGGIDGLVLTKLDVLDGFPTIKICVAYDLDGERLDHFPARADLQAKVKPIFEDVPGWSENTAGIRDWKSLPKAARDFVERLEVLVGCPVSMVSTSPERDDVILRCGPVF